MTRELVRYRTLIMDSARWDGFVFRDDDIVISTPAKCGTTWTQMICALLIFQTPELPGRLDQLTVWLDQTVRSREDVFATYEAQTHRRFIKTHTPLDGLPFDERVTYLNVARDPRDVAISMDNHLRNMDMERVLALREAAVGNDDLDELPRFDPPAESTPLERFWHWVEEPDVTNRGLAPMLHHVETFWAVRDRSNIVQLHYGDLQDDLEGEMRKLATRLGIDVPDERWPELVRAATFESMKSRADRTAPNATNSIWKDTERFFNRGTSGQWRELLDDDDLRRYERRVRELVDDDLSRWVHRGPIR